MSIVLLQAIRGDSPFSTTQFAGFFLRGNPVLALGSLIRFYRARNEHDTVLITERMGEIRSPLAVDELLDALTDPRFNVRYEAVLSIARMPADPRLTEALITVLAADSPALSVVAAWALGKIGVGQEPARMALQAAMHSKYRSVRAHSVRALGSIGDAEITSVLLHLLTTEYDEGIRVACASTLGKLGVSEAIAPLLQLLASSQDETMRAELALALVRIVGDEGDFVRLFRQMEIEPATAATRTLSQIKRSLNRSSEFDDLRQSISTSAELFAQEELDKAAVYLGEALQRQPDSTFGATLSPILTECAEQLIQGGAARREYLLIVLHLLGAAPPDPAHSLPLSLDPSTAGAVPMESSD